MLIGIKVIAFAIVNNDFCNLTFVFFERVLSKARVICRRIIGVLSEVSRNSSRVKFLAELCMQDLDVLRMLYTIKFSWIQSLICWPLA